MRIKKFRIHICTIALGVIASLAAVGAQAAAMTFTDQTSFLAATGVLTVDNFDAAPWNPSNTNLAQPVVSLGNSWTASEALRATTAVSVSGAQSIMSNDLSPDSIDTLIATLGGTDTAVGGFLNITFTDVVLSAFDAGNVLLGSVASTASSGWQFIGLTTDTAIARIEISGNSPPDDDFVLDDFHFGSAAAVPEPTTLALVGLGLAGIGYRRHRNKQAA